MLLSTPFKHLRRSPGVEPFETLSNLSAISNILDPWVEGAHYGEQRKEAARRIQAFLNSSNGTKLMLAELGLLKLPHGLCEILSSVRRLQHFSLAHNELTTLPSDFGALATLQHLDLSFNQLTALPNSMKGLTKLRRISLAHNQLVRLPECLEDSTALQVLNLSENKLIAVSDIGGLISLQWLDLSQNQLTKLPSGMKDLTALQWLDLSKNFFSLLPDCIANLSALQHLDLSENHLNALPNKIGGLIKLQQLILSDNKLVTLPDGIKGLTVLKVLELSNNQLTALPNAALQLPSDCKIDLTDCPLLNPVCRQLQQLTSILDCQSPRIRLPAPKTEKINEPAAVEKVATQTQGRPSPTIAIRGPISKPWTVIVIKCQDVPSNQSLYIRGNGAGINWQRGVKLNQIDWETFEFRTNTPFSGELEFKVLLSDDQCKWEEGANHKVAQGKKLKVVPVFPRSVAPALKKTVIELEYSVPEGKTLYLSGTGPLGQWDRKTPMTRSCNEPCSWFASFDGEFPPFEYKVLLEDQWEGQGTNRNIVCGRKGQIKSPRF